RSAPRVTYTMDSSSDRRATGSRPRGRIVEDQQLRLGRQCERERQSGALPAREFPRLRGDIELEVPDDRIEDAGVPMVKEARLVFAALPHGHPVIERMRFGHVSDS